MVQIAKLENEPNFKEIIHSVYQVLGNGFNKHSTISELVRHLPKSDRGIGKDIVGILIRIGYLRKHRTDTFSWTAQGLGYAKEVLQLE